jgi:membrane protein YdbS with pleckstrin-like domain
VWCEYGCLTGITVWIGLVFPVFVGLLLLFMLVDLVYILIAFTVLGLFLLLAMLVVAPCYFLCLKQATTTEDTTTPQPPPAPES